MTIDNPFIISLIDLTSLGDNDKPDKIKQLCQQAHTPLGDVAAVCIYPRFLNIAKPLLLDSHIQLATVINFPSGTDSTDKICSDITHAIKNGANEIDLVIPYQDYCRDLRDTTVKLIRMAKTICGPQVKLKVILETAALQTPDLIHQASCDAILAGADFLKTSTGKHPAGGADLNSAEIMLNAIKLHPDKLVGFKAAGGIKQVEQAHDYIQLAQNIMGADWVTPSNFRLGASSLLEHCLQ